MCPLLLVCRLPPLTRLVVFVLGLVCPPERYSPSRYGLSTVLEPTSYRDAIVHPEGQFAMAEEIAALERTGTWDLVSLPPRVRPITCKWVYKIKTHSDGSLER